MALGKIIRINEDGTVPADNPFQDKGELAKTYWSLGHRNALGLAFDQAGQLWSHEMGPRDGDELNLIAKVQITAGLWYLKGHITTAQRSPAMTRGPTLRPQSSLDSNGRAVWFDHLFWHSAQRLGRRRFHRRLAKSRTFACRY